MGAAAIEEVVLSMGAVDAVDDAPNTESPELWLLPPPQFDDENGLLLLPPAGAFPVCCMNGDEDCCAGWPNDALAEADVVA